MKKLLICLLALCLIPACMAPQSPSPERLDRVSVALVEPIVDKDDNTTTYKAYCSGTFVSSWQILTARHCVMAMAELKGVEPATVHIHYITSEEVAGYDKEPWALHLAVVEKLDEDHDLALLDLPKHGKPLHGWARIGDLPSRGDEVVSVSTPRGLYFSYTKGVVSQLWQDDTRGQMLQVEMPGAYFGSSGGGLFDKYGDLVGVTDRLAGSPGLIDYIGTDSIAEFLDK